MPFLPSMTSGEKSTVISVFFIFIFCHYTQSAFRIFVLNVQEFDWVCQGMDFYELILSGIRWDFWTCKCVSTRLPAFQLCFLQPLFSTTLPLSFRGPEDRTVPPCVLSQRSLGTCSFFKKYLHFSFCWIISIDLPMISTNLPAFSSVVSILP